ncbi:MAG: hypothetical protein NT075_14995 [Chloroflexi bacterium]|nr:hypothetical protein [Chloroflexota bacterium]
MQLRDTAYDAPWHLSSRNPSACLLGMATILCISALLYLLLPPAALAFVDSADWQQSSTQGTSGLLAARTPAIFVQGGLAGPVGSMIAVPIAFDSVGDHVAALSFTLDYDDTCLALDPADRNRDGLPDSIVMDVPAQFFPSISVNPGGQSGRLSVVLADYIPPLAALLDTAALVTIQFQIVCPLAPGLITYASVDFATAPAVGFSDNTGRDLPGVARAGVVEVIGAIPGITPTPTVTPTPLAGSPTPTLIPTAPSTPIPPPAMVLEVSAWPERITRADRSVLFILDYVVLTTKDDLALDILVPQHSYFDAMASTFGWQCGSEVVNQHCRFPLYDTAHPNNLNGRLFFAVGLNWPLPASVTQIAWTATVMVNDEPSNQVQPLVLPVLPADSSLPSNPLTLDLSTANAEFVVGHDHELLYTFTYTNSGQVPLAGIAFHLVLPPATLIRQAPSAPFDWHCRFAVDGQQECALSAAEISPGAPGKQQFVLSFVTAVARSTKSAIVLVVYATQAGRVLNSHSLVVPMQQPEGNEPEIIRLFLPLISNTPN